MFRGKSILSRGHSKCKGPGVDTYLICSRRKKGAWVDFLVCVCVCVCVTVYKSKECSWKAKKIENV